MPYRLIVKPDAKVQFAIRQVATHSRPSEPKFRYPSADVPLL